MQSVIAEKRNGHGWQVFGFVRAWGPIPQLWANVCLLLRPPPMGKIGRTMTTFSKKQISKGVRNMGIKTISWSSVCKQLSGISGIIDMGDVKVRPIELMQALGVHVLKNNYTPKDIFTAWSGYMVKDGMCCVARNVGYKVSIGDKKYQLFSEADKAKAVHRFELCNLVSAADKQKGSTDVVVTVQNVLRGLQQSIYINDTLDKIAKSAEKCGTLKSGWVNMAEKASDESVWKTVIKTTDGNWTTKVIEKATHGTLLFDAKVSLAPSA